MWIKPTANIGIKGEAAAKDVPFETDDETGKSLINMGRAVGCDAPKKTPPLKRVAKKASSKKSAKPSPKAKSLKPKD